MLIRSALIASALFATTASAFADYYIVHGPDRRCRVVERYVPGEERDIVRVGPLSFGTRDEAERQVKVVCHDDGYYRGEERVEERHERR